MSTQLLLLILCVIFGTFFAVTAIASMYNAQMTGPRHAVAKRLGRLKHSGVDMKSEVKRARKDTATGLFDRLLTALALGNHLQRIIQRANANTTPGKIALMSLGFFAAGAGITGYLMNNIGTALLVGGVLASLPLLWILRMGNKRMQKFEAQLPDALDLVARALKAGQAFTGGLRMIADEMDDPISTEIGKTLDEINFGIGVQQALNNLSRRVDSQDLRFFIVSVNIQRETGGNLAEIVGNIASLIRERFKLYGKVKVLSAEGRLSALLLLMLPVAMAIVIYFLNPEYMILLFTTETGKMLLGGALMLMALGALVIKKMIAIKV